MKVLYATIVCATLALAALVPIARADEFDELLDSRGPAVSESQPGVDGNTRLEADELTVEELAVERRSGMDPSLGESISPTLPQIHTWQEVIGPAADQHAAASARRRTEEPAPTGMSLVPEPSAVALAALALVYFLVFGRRRTLG